jgi:predicted DNA-binding ribbon-helix-helix protein
MQQGRPLNTSTVKKRSVAIRDRKTSISLENEFWDAINDIARLRQMSLGNIVGLIEDGHRGLNLSSAIRVFVLEYYRSRSDAERTETSPRVVIRQDHTE